MVTIKDIARIAGCSVSTVSRALNNHGDVSEEARKKILKIVKEQNFYPNANAKKLKQKPKGIAIIVKGANNIMFADILEKIHKRMNNEKEEALVFYISEDANEVSFAKKVIQESRPLGIIFLGGNLKYFKDEFSAIEIPSVLITNSAKDLKFNNLSSFSTDDFDASKYICEYCIKQGHKNIGIVGGNANSSMTQVSYRRIMGCKEAFEENNIKFDENKQYEPCHFSMEEGYEATLRLLKRNKSLSAIIAVGDIIAIGALRAINDFGLRVPEDISLTGYDGLPLTQFTNPRITTVAQNTELLAKNGVESILGSVQTNNKRINKIIPFKFMEGESVKNLKEKGR